MAGNRIYRPLGDILNMIEKKIFNILKYTSTWWTSWASAIFSITMSYINKWDDFQTIAIMCLFGIFLNTVVIMNREY